MVLPPHGVGQPFRQGLLHWPGMQEGAEQGTQHICSFGCHGHHWQISTESSPCKYSSQLGERMTHPTGMDLVDHFLAPVHGQGIYRWQISRTHLCLPYTFTTLPSMVQLSLWDHHCPTSSSLVLVSSTTPCSTFPRETLQEKALRKIIFARKHGSVTKCLSHMITHGAHLPPPVGFPWLQGWLSSWALC
jgi:hypothetical protein